MSVPTKLIDPRLIDYAATEEQRIRIQAVIDHKGIKAAAKAMGWDYRSLARSVQSCEARMKNAEIASAVGTAQASARAKEGPKNRLGFYVTQVSDEVDADGEVGRTWVKQVPDSNQDPGGIGAGPERDGHSGYLIKGVSTLFDAAGNQKAQWLKTKIDPSAQFEAFEEWCRKLAEPATGLSPVIPPPSYTTDRLLSLYAMGDPHFGMYSWAEETGDDFDLSLARKLTTNAIDRLVQSSPASQKALLLQAGDMFHADDSSNQTPASKNALDVDTRYAKVIQVGLEAMVYCIQRMLEKHQEIIAWMVPGNHDPHSSFALAIALHAWFRNEPRVTIDLNPGLYRYMLFGKVLIGAHHGHGAKQQDLPLIMAVDEPELWGASTARYIYQGHIHHDSVKEIQGVRCESLRTMAGKDAWHAGKGYRSARDMRVIIHHQDHGEVERHTCAASMIL